MIRIFILDDEIGLTIAGLIPLPKDPKFDVDVEQREILARRYFQIVVASNIREGLKKLEDFEPDLCIIDINLDCDPVLHDNCLIENGIDFFRHLAKKGKYERKILFSHYATVPEYINKLTKEENDHFVPKSVNTGYEILANRIKTYFREISYGILAQSNEIVVAQILCDIAKKRWDQLQDYPISIGTREISYGHLAMHKAYPEYRGRDAALVYEEPMEAIKAMIDTIPAFTGKGRGVNRRPPWNSPWLEQRMNEFCTLWYQNEKHRIIEKAKTIVRWLVDPNANYKPIDLEFRIRAYEKERAGFQNGKFKAKFLNGMSIRLAFLFFEHLFREKIDYNSVAWKSPAMRYKVKNFVANVIVAIKKTETATDSQRLSQDGMDLNMSFRVDQGTLHRMTIDPRTEVYSFENDWLGSSDCNNLKNEIMGKITV